MEISASALSVGHSLMSKNSKNVCMQLAELQKAVSDLLLSNKTKHEQIQKHKPSLNYRLHKPKEPMNASKGVGRELLLRQLDKLLEEQAFLDREISLIRIKNEEQHAEREEVLSNQITPYQALRSIWQKSRPKHESAFDHIESLNEVVGHIRSNLKRITQIESSSSQESQSEYLKYYAIQKCASETCNNCATLQQSKNQLRLHLEQSQLQYAELKNKNEELAREITKKDEQIRKLTTKMMQRETEAQSKFYYLERRLMEEQEQVKQLQKHREELQKHIFFNEEENYQLLIVTEHDLSHYSQRITLQLSCLLDLLANNNLSTEQQDRPNLYESPPVEPRAAEPELAITTDFGIPELTFGKADSSREKALTKKASMTDRPRTERLRTLNQKFSLIQDLEISSRKYVRTNQLTTKRNNRINPFSYLETKCAATTVKMSDSPKNMEDTK